jgi:hypothetical protein
MEQDFLVSIIRATEIRGSRVFPEKTDKTEKTEVRVETVGMSHFFFEINRQTLKFISM